MRLFIALKLPENIRNVLFSEAENLQKQGLFNGKITEKENLHLTLKFLADVDEKNLGEIIERLKEVKVPKFDAIFSGMGVFDEYFVRIIWARLLGVDELQKEIDIKLKHLFKMEERFMSHITIARVKSIKEKRSLIDAVKNIKLGNLKFRVECFELMKSELLPSGPVYSVVEKFELV